MAKLTVVHLKDAVLALDVWELVSHLEEIVLARVVHLLRFLLQIFELELSARWVHIVSAPVVGVDRAGVTVVLRAVQLVRVETFLGYDALGIFQVSNIAKPHLDVALGGGIKFGWIFRKAAVWSHATVGLARFGRKCV